KKKNRQLLTEPWSATWTVSYKIPRINITMDYTGNVYGRMLLPLLSETDPRPEKSPVWTIQNIKISKKIGPAVELYGGIKNLLNWTPARNAPFLIARAHDPFDKEVIFGTDGMPLATTDNPYSL